MIASQTQNIGQVLRCLFGIYFGCVGDHEMTRPNCIGKITGVQQPKNLSAWWVVCLWHCHSTISSRMAMPNAHPSLHRRNLGLFYSCGQNVEPKDQSHKSHNAPIPSTTMHHFETEMCTRMCTFSVTKCVLWYICLMHCGICQMGLLSDQLDRIYLVHSNGYTLVLY